MKPIIFKLSQENEALKTSNLFFKASDMENKLYQRKLLYYSVLVKLFCHIQILWVANLLFYSTHKFRVKQFFILEFLTVFNHTQFLPNQYFFCSVEQNIIVL